MIVQLAPGGGCDVTVKLSNRTGVGNAYERKAKYHTAGTKTVSVVLSTSAPFTSAIIVLLSHRTRNVIISPGMISLVVLARVVEVEYPALMRWISMRSVPDCSQYLNR